MKTWPALEIGVTAAPDLLQAELLDYGVSAIHDTSPASWRVFFSSPADRDAAAAGLAARFPGVSLHSIDVPDEDWAAQSQASLRAIRVGHVIVAPPWDVPDAAGLTPGTTCIVIQPSRGFGTGHHATTRLCLAALQTLDLTGTRVIDVGTGSGVLAITASRLGAAAVAGVDDDPDALQAARENVALNAGAEVTLHAGDVRAHTGSAFDVVLANLTGALLIQAAGALHDLAAAAGVLILSGFMAHEEAAVRTAYAGLAMRARTEEDEWVCVTLQRP